MLGSLHLAPIDRHLVHTAQRSPQRLWCTAVTDFIVLVRVLRLLLAVTADRGVCHMPGPRQRIGVSGKLFQIDAAGITYPCVVHTLDPAPRTHVHEAPTTPLPAALLYSDFAKSVTRRYRARGVDRRRVLSTMGARASTVHAVRPPPVHVVP